MQLGPCGGKSTDLFSILQKAGPARGVAGPWRADLWDNIANFAFAGPAAGGRDGISTH